MNFLKKENDKYVRTQNISMKDDVNISVNKIDVRSLKDTRISLAQNNRKSLTNKNAFAFKCNDWNLTWLIWFDCTLSQPQMDF